MCSRSGKGGGALTRPKPVIGRLKECDTPLFDRPECVQRLRMHGCGYMPRAWSNCIARTPPEGTWMTHQPRRKKRIGSKMCPSKAQAAVGQAQALLEVTQLTSNPYTALHDDKVLDSDISTGRASGSTVSLPLGPVVTPRTADDL
ncbi:hypothetical protein NDU88_004878 [Pleurodeles waltl]|uniref:Uncharacterized protein n=1 Tax=Pleurodeles waltl TaxID=8319 RepID=A0AAV7RI37_PLEWA|nr:hypothetical protein NDU88_004878 [Pleurodeles waltl]